jgi:hypothetical protein
MQWRKIETYPLPTEAWDFRHPKILVYSPTDGIQMVRCVKEDDGSRDEDAVRYTFRYDNDGFTVEDATHWMPLPEPPKKVQLRAYNPKKDFGDLMTVAEFIECQFINDDGEGVYATLDSVSNVSVDLNNVKINDPVFTHILWYNK